MYIIMYMYINVYNLMRRLSVGGIVGDWLQSLLRNTDRIFGGNEVTALSSHPYMAVVVLHPVGSILRKKIKIGVCSAAIMTPNKLITSASCFEILQGVDL
jgi:hypothetical protein